MTPGLRHIYAGKVRELYLTADGILLLVATDRISAFDYVLATPIPEKAKFLPSFRCGGLADWRTSFRTICSTCPFLPSSPAGRWRAGR